MCVDINATRIKHFTKTSLKTITQLTDINLVLLNLRDKII